MSSKSNIKDKWDKNLEAMLKTLIKTVIEHYLTVATDLCRELDLQKDKL